MTQEQRNKKAEQLRLAAQIVETGCEWEARGNTQEWFALLALTPEEAICKGCEIRIKKTAWKLPDPPAGRKWHRDDWTQDMLPDGWRPLLDGEAREIGDKTGGVIAERHPAHENKADGRWTHTSTRRPLPSPVIPVPEGYRELLDNEKDGRWIEGAKWPTEIGDRWIGDGCAATTGFRIIVPVAKPRVPLEPCDVPPGSVVRAVDGTAAESGGWSLILVATKNGITAISKNGRPELFSWEFAFHNQEIKRPTETEWMPCSKEAKS